MPRGRGPPPNALWAASRKQCWDSRKLILALLTQEWIQEAADQANACGSKAGQTLNRAAKAIKRCPDKMVHPVEAQQLSGVGPKVVEIITRKLQQWCDEHNQQMPLLPQRPAAPKGKKRASDGSQPAAAKKAKAGARAGGRRPSVSSSCASSSEEDENAPGPSRKRTGGSFVTATGPNKTYVPNPRSGGWGILIGLYVLCTEPSAQKFRTKEEIVKVAQKYCDSSYTDKAAGQTGARAYITTWKSVDTLINKAYVVQTNTRPKTFALTRQGFDVAASLSAKEKLPIADFVDIESVTATTAEVEAEEAAKGKAKEKEKGKGKRQAAPPPSDPYVQPASERDFLRDLGVPRPPRKEPDARDKSFLAALNRQEAARRADDDAEVSGFLGRLVANSTAASNPRINPAGPASSGAAPPVPSAGTSKGKGKGKAMNGRNAASGAYARTYKEPAKEVSDSLGAKSFEYVYLTKENVRTRRVTEAVDESLHPETMERTYKIEFRSAQSLHPFASANVIGVAPAPRPAPGWGPEGRTQVGWLIYSKSAPSAPGFAALSKAKAPAPVPVPAPAPAPVSAFGSGSGIGRANPIVL